MNRNLFSKSIVVLVLLTVMTSISFSQAANSTPSSGDGAEVIGENDRLSFMQTESVPESQEPSSSGLLLKTLGALLLVVGLIFFGAWGAKKLGFGGLRATSSPDDLELTILSTVSMGNGRSISTLRFGERTLLVGSTAESFTLLAEEKNLEKPSLGKTPSVADLLAEENDLFGVALQNAQFKLGNWNEKS